MAHLKLCFKFGHFSSLFLFKFARVTFNSFFKIKFKSTMAYEKKSVYFFCSEDLKHIQVHINLNELNMNRMVLFERPITETLQSFLSRLEQKLQKLSSKKIRAKKKKISEDDTDTSIPTFDLCFLLHKERLVPEITFDEVVKNYVSGDLKLRIMDNEYNVILNAPMVKIMTLPPDLRVGSLAHPVKFVTDWTNKDESEFTWYRSLTRNVKSWEKCGEGMNYFITNDDLNYFLKLVCIPKCQSNVGPACEIISGGVVKTTENIEELKKRQEFTKEKLGANEFRIVSYNILANTYTQTKDAKTVLFNFCDKEYLDFSYRRNLIIFEICFYNADVICLQEVDEKFYKDDLKHLFSYWGYDSFFHEKSGSNEGCAFFYDFNKFKVLSVNQYTFTNELTQNPLFKDFAEEVNKNSNVLQRLQNVPSIIQVVVLNSVADSNHIIVFGNTHFYFHPDASHIRLLQGSMSLRILQNTVQDLKKQFADKKVSVVLCGDFNSTPEKGFHELLNKGFVDSNHSDWSSNKEEVIKNLSFSHSLKLKSAYNDVEYTNYTPIFKGCLDYIYFQTDELELRQTVPFPNETVLSQFEGIPSKYFPSDHLALVADFKLKS